MSGDIDTCGSPSARILVVDDDPTLLEIAVTKLAAAGHDVALAENGAQGWNCLKARAFDLAVVDLDMPEVDGYTLIEWIRNDADLEHLPVIVVTSHEDAAAIDRAFEAGASSFVSKPVNWPLFLHQMRYVRRANANEQRLRRGKDEAERLVRLKNSFLSVINHELRTPLTHIIGFAEVLQKESEGPLGAPVYLDHVNEIANAGRRLYGAITEVILLSRGLAGELELTEGEYRISTILSEVLDEIDPVARLRGITVAVSRMQDDPYFKFDIKLLGRCLIALLDNAVKFSPEGGLVRVDVAAAPDGGVRFAIADQGPGMSAGRIADCFEPFVQSDMSFRRSAEGTGLGLALVRTLIELHDGQLKLTSAEGAGTTSTLTLPAWRVVAREHESADSVMAPG